MFSQQNAVSQTKLQSVNNTKLLTEILLKVALNTITLTPNP
jgi:hypothetical protein